MPDAFFRGFFPKTVSDSRSLEGIPVTPAVQQEQSVASIIEIENALNQTQSLEEVLTVLEKSPNLQLANGQPIDLDAIRTCVKQAIAENKMLPLETLTLCDVRGIPRVWKKINSFVEQSIHIPTLENAVGEQVTSNKGTILRPEKVFGFKNIFSSREGKSIEETTQETEPKKVSTILRGTRTFGGRLVGAIKKGAHALSEKLDEMAEKGEQEYAETRKRRYEGLRKTYELQTHVTETTAPTEPEKVTESAQAQEDREMKEGPESLPSMLMDKLIVKKDDTLANDIEQERQALQKVEKIEHLTQEKRKVLLEKIGPFGKKLLSYLDGGADFLNKNVSTKTKVLAGVGLFAAGSLASFASPALLTIIGAASIFMRVVSAAATYTALQKELAKRYALWEEKNGVAVSATTKAAFSTGAVLVAGGAGHIAGFTLEGIGKLFEQLATSGLSENIAQTIRDALPPSFEVIEGQAGAGPPGVSEVATTKMGTAFYDPETLREQIQAAKDAAQTTVTQAPSAGTVTLETVATVAQNPEILYELTKGDSLWSALRKTLTAQNFEGFSELSSRLQDAKIQTLITEIEKDPRAYGITSGDINKISEKAILNFSKLITR